MEELNEALNHDTYFSDMVFSGDMEKYSEEVRFKVKKNRQVLSASLADRQGISKIDVKIDEFKKLEENASNLRGIDRALLFERYLSTFEINFIAEPKTDRTVVMIRPKSSLFSTGNNILQRNLEPSNEIVYKNIKITRTYNLENLRKFKHANLNLAPEIKLYVAKMLLYQLSFTLMKVGELDIFHTNIRLENILLEQLVGDTIKKSSIKSKLQFQESKKDLDVRDIRGYITGWNYAKIKGSQNRSELSSDFKFKGPEQPKDFEFRAPEMFLTSDFENLSYIDASYRYTSKEDVFGLASTMVSFLGVFCLESIPDDLEKLLDKMLWPLNVETFKDKSNSNYNYCHILDIKKQLLIC